MGFIIIGLLVYVVLSEMANSTKKEQRNAAFRRLVSDGKLSKKAYKKLSNMSLHQQDIIMGRLCSYADDDFNMKLSSDALFNQFVQLAQQDALAQTQSQFSQQMEIDRLMSTGIEFGGFNSDLNLNPGMMNEHFNNMHSSHDFNNFNNFGGGMGGGMGMF